MSEYNLPPGRSTIRRRIHGLLRARQGARLHLREIARQVGTSAGTAARELGRLTEAGIVTRTVEGRQVYFHMPVGEAAPRRGGDSAMAWSNEVAAPYGSPATDALGFAIARRLRRELQAVYGRRLVDVYLFGSRARGDQEEDSDVDILIVLDEIASYADDLRRSSPATADLALESGVSISRLLTTADAWERRDRPILRAIAAEGVRA